MKKRSTTVRMPEELTEKADVIARGRGISINALMLEALEVEIERLRHDDEFVGRLRKLTGRDKEILDRLAESGISPSPRHSGCAHRAQSTQIIQQEGTS